MPLRLLLLCRAYPRLQVDAQPVPFKLKRGLALLVYLCELARPVARTQIADVLWPDAPPGVGRARLRRLCHELNSTVGLDIVAGDTETLWLKEEIFAIESDVEIARHHARQWLETPDSTSALALLEPLLAPDSHQFLDGFELDSDLFNAWRDARRSELERLVTRTLQRLSAALCQPETAAHAGEAAKRLIALEPLAESGHAALMRALVLMGDAGALEEAYFKCAELLRHELGIRPSAQLESTYKDCTARLQHPHGVLALHATSLPKIRFANTGNGTVAFFERGQGSSTLLVNMGLWSHIEVAWDEPRIRAVLDRLGQHFGSVVLMDRRGSGLAERLSMNNTTDAGVEDLNAVRQALGIERIWLLGASVGGTVAIEYAAAYPEHVEGLLLYAVNARGTWAPDYPWALTPEQLEKWIGLLQSQWGSPTSLAQFAPSMVNDEATKQWWARMLRQSTSRNGLNGVLDTLRTMDVRASLPLVKTPTLVVQRSGDRIVREGAALYLAEHIAGAQLALLPGHDHLMWVSDTGAVLTAMESFLERRRQSC